MTDRERWNRLQELFHAAGALPEPERRPFLETECAGDPGLLEDVLALLEEDARTQPLFDEGLGPLAGRLAGQEEWNVTALRFGPYRVRERIGEGGMGVVFRAERDDLGQEVAIKVLRDAALSPVRRRRFAAEQRTLAQLDHASIAKLHDADVLPDGTPWFAMEYVAGRPLTEYCRDRGTSLEGRLLLLRSVCEAVRHAHSHLVIHRDLKPSNVLVREDGSVKLLDFGIAKEIESADVAVRQTRTGLRLLTPAYAAPEQLRGERVGTQADVYALGVMLYELLTGRLPHDTSDLSPPEAARKVAETTPVRPSTAALRDPEGSGGAPTRSRAAWADLDVLCLTAMHPDPERRYRTAEAFLRDIDHYLDGEPLEARPDTIGYRAGKFVRRNGRVVAAASVALVLVTGLVGYYTLRLGVARDAALAQAERTERIQRFMLDLFRGQDEEVGPAESLRVVTLLDRGVRDARSLQAEPAVQAELLHTLGGVYRQLGRLDRADSLLGVALDRRLALHGPDHVEVGETEVALGALRSEQARYDEAERLARRGLERLRRRLPSHHPSLARATATLGEVLEERGDYPGAIRILSEAVRIQEASGDRPDPDLAATLTELGNSHFYAGDLEAADSIFRTVLALDRRLYGDDHPVVAGALVNVGAVLHERGRYAEAERRYRDALAITRRFHGERHPKTAEGRTMLARALIFQDRLDEAAPLLRRAADDLVRVYGENHPLVASTLNEIGSVALLQDRSDDARSAFERVLRIYRSSYPGDHFAVGVATSNLASVLLRQAAYREAESLFGEAVRIFTESQGAEHLNTGIARIKLGRTLLRQQRFAEAIRETSAGYEILVARTDPGVSWLETARRDLAEAHAAMGEEDRAERFRAELRRAP